LLLAWWLGENTRAFLDSLVVIAAVGMVLWYPVRHSVYELRLRDGFLITAALWIIASLVTALPFMLMAPHLSFVDAVFESTSGLTTTGATVISGLDELPRSLLFYRQLLQFFGGMGIVILAVAIMPMLKVGGMQLVRAESTGPTRDNKLTPRIAETARALWFVYLALNALCAAAYWIGGMSLFDAVCHAMSTVASGGFSTHDASFGYWDSPLLESIACVLMLVAATNFGMHWYAWRRATLSHYQADSELRALLLISLLATTAITLQLWQAGTFPSFGEALRHGAFQTISNLSTTGFVTTGFVDWPGAAPLILVLIAFIGGASGSTAGGIKVARWQMLVRQGLREVRQLVHPKGQFVVKLGGKRVSESVVISVGGFFTLYVLCYFALVMMLAATGTETHTALAAIAASLTNVGPGLGDVAVHFASLDDFATWVCSFSMILGRLEVFTILVLLTPQFWNE
ncbi:MAG: TrkH family potassium uptake protein, partial [Variovorax sp.]